MISQRTRLKATPLRQQPLEAINEGAPLNNKEATEQETTIEEEEKKEAKPKARPRPKEVRDEEESKPAKPERKGEEEEEEVNNKSPKIVMLTRSRLGTQEEETKNGRTSRGRPGGNHGSGRPQAVTRRRRATLKWQIRRRQHGNHVAARMRRRKTRGYINN